MSPQWSSLPRISVTRTFFSLLENRPIEMPAAACLMGTPASIMARVPTQMLAMEDDPFEPMMSDTSLTV